MNYRWKKNKVDGRPEGFSRRPVGGAAWRRIRRNWRTIFGWAATVAVAGVFAMTIGGIAMFAWIVRDLPDPNKLQDRNLPQTTKIYDRTGKILLYEMHGDQKRTLVTLEDISLYAKDATVAAEDRTFYQHKGFRPLSIARAILVTNLLHGAGSGGSTITQQLVKNTILSSEKTITRKLKELIISLELERRYSKDDILKMYLNEIPYGSLAYGIESASQTFFDKHAKDLTVDESALLAVLPRATTYYSPYGNHREDLIARRDRVLEMMAEDGKITAEEAEEAKRTDTLAKVVRQRTGIIAPHFVFYVKDLLADKFGEQAVEEGGLKVTTTLDVDKQELAEKSIADHIDAIRKDGATSAALLAIDPKSGDIVTMVGSADYFDDSINGQYNALTGRLQPGSSIKPMVYALAMERGYTPSTVVYDVPTEFSTVPGQSYAPGSFDGKFRGPVTLKTALAGSLNIPAVKVLYLVGVNNFLDYATKELGYTIPDRKWLGLSITLGGVTLKPIEHINAFGSLANEGTLAESRAILKVEDAKGNILLEAKETKAKRVWTEETARQITDILSDNSARAYVFGENNTLTLPGRPVAAKTGTTNNYKDAWTIGYTPSLVAGVWAGDSVKGKAMNRSGGSRAAAPIWNQFMRAALEGTTVESFTPPQPVVTGKPVLDGDKSGRYLVKVDRFSGKLATELTPPESIEERAYGATHDILFFVRRDDPRGPMPERPDDDPQYRLWEDGVTKWSAESGEAAVTGDVPPTEYDDVHTAANQPSVYFAWPSDGTAWDTRQPTVGVSAGAPRGISRVDYLLDGELVGSSSVPPFSAALAVPNHFAKGYHVLTAVAYDDVLNSARATVNVNLTAPPGELGLEWMNLYDNSSVSLVHFPMTVKVRVQDPQSISSLRLTATFGNRVFDLGRVDSPALPSMAFTWQEVPQGTYMLTAEAELVTGDRRVSSIRVTVE